MATRELIINVEVQGAKDAERGIDKVTESLQDSQQATEQAAEATEDYNSQLLDTIKDTKVFGLSINSLSQSFRATIGTVKSASTALKGFKVALASTGVGLIVIALGSLVTWLQRSRQGVDFLSDAFKVIGETIRIVLDRIGQLGGALVKLFQGDFKGAFNDAKAALSGFNDELRTSLALRLEIERATRDADQFDREAISRRADLERDIAELVFQTRDIEKTTARERLELIAQAQAKQEELNQLNIQAAKNRLEIAQQELEQLDETEAAYEDAFEARQQAYAAVVAAEKRGLDQQRELQNRRTTEIRAQAAADKAAAEQRVLEEAEARQQELLALQDFDTQKLELDKNYQEQKLAIENDTAQAIENLNKKLVEDERKTNQARYEINKATNEAVLSGTQELLGGIAALAGQNTALGKAAAIAEATINTYKGVAAIIGDSTLPTVAKPFFIAAALAQGLAAVKQITSVPLPKVQVVQTPFADGGYIQGNSHARGGVWLNAEGGEYIINKQAMRDPINRGIVEAINEGKQSRGRSFQQGGFVPGDLQLLSIEEAIRQTRPVLVLEDLDRAQQGVRVTDSITTLS